MSTTEDTDPSDLPIVDFHYRADEQYLREPWERIGRLRDEHPIFATPFEDRNIWMVTGYDQVREAFQNYGAFSSHTLNAYGPSNHPDDRIIPAEIDPPLHGQFRQMILSHMSPHAIKAMEPKLRGFVTELIDGFIERGECEFIADFAKKFPTQIFMMIYGLPIEKADYMVGLSDAYLHAGADEASQQRSADAYAEIAEFLVDLIAKRRAAPRDDLLSHLMTQTVDDRPITDLELRNYSITLYLGGLDTVAMQLGHMFAFLARNHGHRQQILDDPSIIPSASEELLRYFPILTPGRYVEQDIEFHGCPMKKGDRVLVSTVAAGRDGSAFDDPDTVDLTRTANRHLSFGAGPHRCVGSNLARAELVIGLEEWHRRIPHYRLASDTLHYHGGSVLGLESLDLRWD
jgi:cytochrome P450